MSLSTLTEADIQHRLHQFFGKWFDVYFEVWSLCRTKRIDLILYHNSDFNREYPIGIEIKLPDIKKGTEIADWCKQAAGYSRLLFDEKRAFIFTAPQISGSYLEEGSKVKKHDITAPGYLGAHHNMNSFIYRTFGIGELQKYREPRASRGQDFYRLVMNTKIIWDSFRPLEFRTDNLQKL